MNSSTNPNLYITLQQMIGRMVVVHTAGKSQRGVLRALLPDYMVIEDAQMPIFIRLNELVGVVLEGESKTSCR
ncbi:YuzF family protein [Lysinibacillus piscis]|nr:YuzF family protein [Lysinibacillus sp. KH24]